MNTSVPNDPMFGEPQKGQMPKINKSTSESVDCLPPDETAGDPPYKEGKVQKTPLPLDVIDAEVEVTPYWTILDLLEILEAGGVNPNAIIEVKECTRVDNPPKQSSDPTRYYVITIRKRK